MELTHRASIVVNASPEVVYSLVSDVTRTGEWSPTCRACEWEDPSETGVGARFTGHNDNGARQWSTTSTIVAADPGRTFAWEVGAGYVRWAYLFQPVGGGTELTHTWEFTETGQAFFHEKYGDDAPAQMEQRTAAARCDMPRTLDTIREIAEREAASVAAS